MVVDEIRALAAEQTTFYKGYQVSALRNMFDQICDPNDWKGPVACLLPKKDFDLARAAVEFFAASELKVLSESVTGILSVYADGYRAGPCGDC